MNDNGFDQRGSRIGSTVAQIFRFGLVGFSNVLFGYAMYALFLTIFRKTGLFPSVDYLVSQALEFAIGVLWSFYWNNRMVFTLEEGQTRNLWLSLIKTYITYSFTGLFLSTILLLLWVRVLHISEFIAPVINLTVTVPLNFIINKFWAFRTKDPEE